VGEEPYALPLAPQREKSQGKKLWHSSDTSLKEKTQLPKERGKTGGSNFGRGGLIENREGGSKRLGPESAVGIRYREEKIAFFFKKKKGLS